MERSFWPLVQHYWNATANFAQRAKKKLKKRTVSKKCFEFHSLLLTALYQLYTVTLPKVFTALGMIHIILKLEICNLPYL